MAIDQWPFYPDLLTEIIDEPQLRMIQSGCSDMLRRSFLIAEQRSDGIITRVHPFLPRQHFEAHCLRLRGCPPSNGPDTGCDQTKYPYDQDADSACNRHDDRKVRDVYERAKRGQTETAHGACWRDLVGLAKAVMVAGRPVAVLVSGQLRKPEGYAEPGIALPDPPVIPSEKEKELQELILQLRASFGKDELDAFEDVARYLEQQANIQWGRMRSTKVQAFLLQQTAALDAALSEERPWRKASLVLAALREFVGCEYVGFYACYAPDSQTPDPVTHDDDSSDSGESFGTAQRQDAVMTLMTDRRSWRSHCSWIGVFPRGAQVRRTTSWSINPLSSRKTMLRPCRRAFFYMRPPFAPPALDFRFVAFAGAPLGFLRAPAAAAQDLPHMGRMVAHAEVALDHLGHPRQGPQLARVPVSGRPFQQQLQQLLFLFRRQARGPSRMRLRCQRLRAAFSCHLLPALHRRRGGPHLPRDLANPPAFPQQGYRPAPPRLQLSRTAFGSHA